MILTKSISSVSFFLGVCQIATRLTEFVFLTLHAASDLLGDKTFEGGNDYEIFTHERTIGHTVTSPDDVSSLFRFQLFVARCCICVP